MHPNKWKIISLWESAKFECMKLNSFVKVTETQMILIADINDSRAKSNSL